MPHVLRSNDIEIFAPYAIPALNSNEPIDLGVLGKFRLCVIGGIGGHDGVPAMPTYLLEKIDGTLADDREVDALADVIVRHDGSRAEKEELAGLVSGLHSMGFMIAEREK